MFRFFSKFHIPNSIFYLLVVALIGGAVVGLAQKIFITDAVKLRNITSAPSVGTDIARQQDIAAKAFWATTSAGLYNLNSGNVGIGTTTPKAKLDIRNGGIAIDSVLQTGRWNSRVPATNTITMVDTKANQ